MINEENNVDFKEFAIIIRKRINFILLITILCVIIAAVFSFYVIKPVYQSKTSIIVGTPTSQTGQNSQTQYSDVMMYQNLMKTYQGIATSKLVAEKTVEKLNDNLTEDKLQSMVNVSTETGTQILDVTVNSTDPKEAAKIADAFSETFIEQSKVVFPTGGSIQIMDNAVLQKSPVKPKKALNIAIGFVLGLFISIGLVFLIEYMDNTIKTENDIEKYLKLPVIGIIPDLREE